MYQIKYKNDLLKAIACENLRYLPYRDWILASCLQKINNKYTCKAVFKLHISYLNRENFVIWFF